MRRVEIGEGEHVAVARLAAEILGVALDAVEQRGRELRIDLGIGRAQILGEDRGSRAVARADVSDRRARSPCARDGDRSRRRRLLESLGRVVAEDVRLDVDEYQSVELVELFGRDDADLDADRVAERLVLGALHLAEGDQGGGRALAAEQRPQRVGAGDAVGVRVGLEQDADFLAIASSSRIFTTRWRFARWSNSSSMSSRISVFQPGAAQGRMVGEVVVGQAVGEDQDRGIVVDLANLAHRERVHGPSSLTRAYSSSVSGRAWRSPPRRARPGGS